MHGKYAQEKHIIIYILELDEYNRIPRSITAKKYWDTFVNTHEKNMENFEKEEGTKDKLLALKEYNNKELDMNDKKLTKNFKKFLRNKSCRTRKEQALGIVQSISFKLVSSSMKRQIT